MLCILYVTAVGFLLGAVGLLGERMLPATAPRRWLWGAIIPVSLFLPGYYRMHHAMPVGTLPGAQPAPRGSWLGTIDPAFWARVESWDDTINLLWNIASAAIVLWGLAAAWRAWRVVSDSRAALGAAPSATVVDGVNVVVTRSLGPATVGLLRSRVVVPRWVLALP